MKTHTQVFTFLHFSILFLLLQNSILLGQIKRSAHWYFGFNAGLNFSTGVAVADTNGSLRSIENSSSISDTAGNLLFYSNGDDIWDKTHSLMSNSAGMFGDQSSTQGSIITPKPGSDSLYYLFNTSTTTGWGMRYSIIDMSQNGGLGAVTSAKNVLLHLNATEEIAGTMHCNGADYWIISRQVATNALIYKAYLLNANGVNPPVVSTFTSQIVLSTNETNGHITFSQDGKQMVSSIMGKSIYLFKFNKSTGILTSQVNIPNNPSEIFYSEALSSDASRLYVTVWNSLTGNYNKVLQYNLLSSNISQSRTTIDSIFYNGSNTGYGWMGSLRLAPDQKIYMSRWHMQNPYVINPNTALSLDSLAVIQNPNLLGSACNYIRNGFYLKGMPTQESLPNFISNFTSTIIVVPSSQSVSINSPTICAGSLAYLSVTVSPSSGTTYSWSSGATSTSVIAVSPIGTSNYSVIGEDGSGCPYSTTSTVFVFSPIQLAISGNKNICIGENITLVGSGANSYTWSNGSSTNSITLSPNTSTSVILSGTDGNGCIVSNTVSLTVDKCLGIKNEIEQKIEMQIFPNPSNGAITVISNTDAELILIDGLGNILNLITVNSSNNRQLILENLAPGLYSIKDNKSNLVRKFVVVR